MIMDLTNMTFGSFPVILNPDAGEQLYKRKRWKRSGYRLPKVRMVKAGRDPYICKLTILALSGRKVDTIVVNEKGMEALRNLKGK